MSNDWVKVEKLCPILKQFHTFTLDMSKHNSHIGIVIPAVKEITCILEANEDDIGVRTTKSLFEGN